MSIFYNSLARYPNATAACVLVHGLNNKPEVLTDIAHLLDRLSIPVIWVCLKGHGQDYKPLKTICKADWNQDVIEAYRLARKKKQIYLVGYSIGAAISLDALTKEVRWDKMVLLAPAIAPKKYITLFQFIAPLFPSLPLLSLAPVSYRAHASLPLKAYEVLFELYKSLRKNDFLKANVPTLVFMDPKDETMDYKKLISLIKKFQLSHWELIPLNSREVVASSRFHHLIIDKKAMGKNNWQLFEKKLAEFLKPLDPPKN